MACYSYGDRRNYNSYIKEKYPIKIPIKDPIKTPEDLDTNTLKHKGDNMKKKIVFYYDNGKTFTAKNVTDIRQYQATIVYDVNTKVDNVSMAATYSVPIKDMIGYEYHNGNRVEIYKLKPCAVIKTEVKRKRK